jgi:hypothetical protein
MDGEAQRIMKNLAPLSFWATCLVVLVLAPASWAQTPTKENKDFKNHGDLGAFFNFTRLTSPSLNLFGVGGRIGFNIQRRIVLEGEAAYDFERTQTRAITVGSVSNSVTTNVHVLHALFGPKINLTFGRTRFFALAKGGLVNYGVGGPVTAGAINNQFGNIVDGDKIGAFYPGGGVDFYIGPISFRAEAGDEIQFVHGGSTNNVRATFGPQLRF